MAHKLIHCVETQIIDTEAQWKDLASKVIEAKQNNFTHVHDYWGHNAYDEYEINDFIKRFKIVIVNETTVVNIRTSQFDVYIGRAGKGKDGYFGNPYKLTPEMQRGSTIEKYKEYFFDRIKRDPEFKERILELKGKRLGCFCKPFPCHGDVIAEYLNKQS